MYQSAELLISVNQNFFVQDVVRNMPLALIKGTNALTHGNLLVLEAVKLKKWGAELSLQV